MSVEVLDNLIWFSAIGPQARLAEIGPGGRAARFRADVSPFCAVRDEDPAAWADLAGLLGTESVAILMGPRLAKQPDGWDCLFEEVATQWIAGALPPAAPEVDFVPLEAEHVPAMLDLTARTEPGPFLAATIETGRYWGVFEGSDLVAMAGERMRAGEWAVSVMALV